ncbi:MAG: helix-turn-helix transcriptional regulator [Atopobiaceae bacterium]|nr:helix-turn-helix transcriptional regulator [Atopobiaceae bacterium]
MEEGSLAANIKRLREERGLSKTDLGDLIGTSHTAIYQYEAGQIVPRMNKIQQLADVFGVSVFELLGKKSDPHEMTAAEVALIANYRKMNAKGRNMLFEQAQMMVASGMYAREQ